MLPASRELIERRLSAEDLVLDVGGWAKPFPRADWVIDLMPYETRGLYGAPPDPSAERFGPDTWIERDLCDREPFPFAADQFDFVVCSQTLEDVRDPVWVCAELNRIGKAGYIEVPSRLEEQSYGVQGPWVGWSHHHWLVDVSGGKIEFVFKPHLLQGRNRARFPDGLVANLTQAERVQTLIWEGSFEFRERVFLDAGELDDYLERFVSERAELVRTHLPGRTRRAAARLAARLRGG